MIVKKKKPNAHKISKWKMLASVENADAIALIPNANNQNHLCVINQSVDPRIKIIKAFIRNEESILQFHV